MTTDASVRPLRRDAALNREKVLDAARAVFALRGPVATVEEVAREAGVGVGTLYRRFDHKQALIDELVGGVRRELRLLARAALDVPDGAGLETLLFETGALQADLPGCLPQLWEHSDAERDALVEYRSVLVELLIRAQAAGRVRPDVVGTDLTMIVWSLRGVVQTTNSGAPGAWRRHLELLVAGLRPPGPAGTALAEAPLDDVAAREILDTVRPLDAVPGTMAP